MEDYKYIGDMDFSIDLPMEDCDRALMIILGKGRYNSHVLHRDGYLGPENCWNNPALKGEQNGD